MELGSNYPFSELEFEEIAITKEFAKKHDLIQNEDIII
jgi:hypothetical protein